MRSSFTQAFYRCPHNSSTLLMQPRWRRDWQHSSQGNDATYNRFGEAVDPDIIVVLCVDEQDCDCMDAYLDHGDAVCMTVCHSMVRKKSIKR